MTYLIAKDLPTLAAGERFRMLLQRPGILQIPGAHCGLAALQAKAEIPLRLMYSRSRKPGSPTRA